MTYDEVEAVIRRRDPDELVRVVRTLWGYVEMTKRPTRKPRTTESKPTWLTPAKEAWESVMGAGSFQLGYAAKYLAPLRKELGDDEIGQRLGFYLRELKRRDETRYVSIKRFAETVGDWNPNELAFNDSDLP